MVFYRKSLLEFILVRKLLGYQQLSLVTILIIFSSSSSHEHLAFYLGIVCAMFAAVFPLGILGEMTSIGTLVAFFLVHISVIIVCLSESIIYFLNLIII